MSKYIKPPEREECIWRQGPPPDIGWWPATSPFIEGAESLRWWDGKKWSIPCHMGREAESAGLRALEHSVISRRSIFWTDRWWEKKA